MSQQINLLNPALLKKKDLLRPVNIIAMFGFLFVGLVAFGIYEQMALANAKQTQQKSAKTLGEIQNLITQVRAKHATNNDKQKLLDEINQLEKKQVMQEAMLEAAQHDQSHRGESYAGLLKAFARQSMEGLWITALSIDQDAQHLSISGRTMDPDLVPQYISRLREEPALRGKTFTNLSMQYKEAKQTLSNGEDDAQSGIKGSKTETVITKESSLKAPVITIPYIEFTLHSEPDKKETATDGMVNAPKVAGVNG